MCGSRLDTVRLARARGAPYPEASREPHMSNPQRTDPAPPLTGLSDDEAGRRRAAGQGNDVQIRTGRTYGRIVRDNVFNFINNLFYVLGVVLLAPVSYTHLRA